MLRFAYTRVDEREARRRWEGIDRERGGERRKNYLVFHYLE
jgi:hypothetical protein